MYLDHLTVPVLLEVCSLQLFSLATLLLLPHTLSETLLPPKRQEQFLSLSVYLSKFSHCVASVPLKTRDKAAEPTNPSLSCSACINVNNVIASLAARDLLMSETLS